jgi:diadenosine tetraphosphatase ApaH/serine/threonine PP2A family protein phosphatase
MRYALFSDIHGNLEALQAVLEDISAESVDRLICLGDIVGYGASPNECVATVRDSGAEAIAGNHDHAATGQLDIEYFNDYATSAILWTRQALSAEARQYLERLPLEIVHPGIRIAHASPHRPGEWEYVLSTQEAARQFELFTEPICFVGHSHYPCLYRLDNGRVREMEFPDNEPLVLPDGCRHLVNVGSVGQPRDNNPQAAWALYEPDDRRLTLRRIDYPVEKAQARILETTLPPFLADRLAQGT